jgi:3'-phosphoadenosine 5'-phosphosulfate sulfotransferase (PAPS reductase)/FAD synthetase
MLRRLLDNPTHSEVVTLFANTSQEDERTLEFVDRVDREWGANIVWLEAVVHAGHGEGTTHRVVDFGSAKRKGEVFESVIAKYGIPNKAYPGACTRELKLNATKSYLRSIEWGPGTYDTAIGIRADEIDRISSVAAKNRFVYPLAVDGITKADVMAFWRGQPFDLQVPEHLGNCTWCWKKSLR